MLKLQSCRGGDREAGGAEGRSVLSRRGDHRLPLAFPFSLEKRWLNKAGLVGDEAAAQRLLGAGRRRWSRAFIATVSVFCTPKRPFLSV
jgi:hypothetical protein